jgi:hypothetical protein
VGLRLQIGLEQWKSLAVVINLIIVNSLGSTRELNYSCVVGGISIKA